MIQEESDYEPTIENKSSNPSTPGYQAKVTETVKFHFSESNETPLETLKRSEEIPLEESWWVPSTPSDYMADHLMTNEEIEVEEIGF